MSVPDSTAGLSDLLTGVSAHYMLILADALSRQSFSPLPGEV